MFGSAFFGAHYFGPSYFGEGSGAPPTATLTLTGPTSGPVGIASSNFTVTAANLPGADTITPHTSFSGSFSPPSFSLSAGAQVFTYTPSADGTHAITITDTLGATITGSPILYVTSPTPTPTPTPEPTPTPTIAGPDPYRAIDLDSGPDPYQAIPLN